MSAITGWAAGLCAVALGCAAVRLLAPEKSLGRLFNLILTALFLCCMVAPLLDGNVENLLSAGTSSTEVEAPALQQQLLAQYRTQVTSALDTVTRQTLDNYHLDYEKVAVDMDMDADGRIYITNITVYLDAQNLSNTIAVKQVMERRLERDVNVEVMS